jgi:hypothetical protein
MKQSTAPKNAEGITVTSEMGITHATVMQLMIVTAQNLD